MEQVNKAKSFTPTQAMRNNAKRGLALREKWNRGGLSASQAKSEGVGSGVARARDIANGNLTLDTVKRMHAFFSRHEKNFNPSKKESDGGPLALALLVGSVAGESARGRKFTELVTDHVLSNEYWNVDASVVNGEVLSNHFRGYRAGARPCL